jgi:hypothetical protein
MDRAKRDASPSALLDFPRDRHAVRILTQPNYGDHHHQLKFAEIMRSRNFF